MSTSEVVFGARSWTEMTPFVRVAPVLVLQKPWLSQVASGVALLGVGMNATTCG